MTTIHLHTKPRKISHLFLGIIFLLMDIVFINLFPPEVFWQFLVFFLFFFGAVFYFTLYGFNLLRRSLLTTIAITLIFILRALGLHHWLYMVLIGAIFLSLEFYLKNKE